MRESGDNSRKAGRASRSWYKIALEWKNKVWVGVSKNSIEFEKSWENHGGLVSLRQPSEDPYVSQEWACLSIPVETYSIPNGSSWGPWVDINASVVTWVVTFPLFGDLRNIFFWLSQHSCRFLWCFNNGFNI